MAIQVLLADSRKILRDGIKAMLREAGVFQLVGEAEDGTAAVVLWRMRKPAVALINLDLPGINGVEAARQILSEDPGAGVALLASAWDHPLLPGAERSGARGLLLETCSQNDLGEALRTVARGGWFAAAHFPRPPIEPARRARPGDGPVLSPRERQVLRLVADGKSSKHIAALLQLEVETIRSYRKSMMKKLGVSNAADATRVAVTARLTYLRVPKGEGASGERP